MMVGQIPAVHPAQGALGPGKAEAGGGAAFWAAVLSDPAEPAATEPRAAPEEEGTIAAGAIDDPAAALVDDSWPDTRTETWIAVSEAAFLGLRQSGAPGSVITVTGSSPPPDKAGASGDAIAGGLGPPVWSDGIGGSGLVPGLVLAPDSAGALSPRPAAGGEVIAGQEGGSWPHGPAIDLPLVGTPFEQAARAIATAPGEVAISGPSPQVALRPKSDPGPDARPLPALPSHTPERALAVAGPGLQVVTGDPQQQTTSRTGGRQAEAGMSADVTVEKTAKIAAPALPADLPTPALPRQSSSEIAALRAPEPVPAATEAPRRHKLVSGTLRSEAGDRAGANGAEIWQTGAGPETDPRARPGRDHAAPAALRQATDSGASPVASDSGPFSTVTQGAAGSGDPVEWPEQGQSLLPGGALPLNESPSQRVLSMPHAPGPHPDVRRIAEQLSAHVGSSSERATEVILQPEELGRVRMVLRAHDGAMTLHLIADRPETAELMRRNIDQLANDFRSLGYTSLDFKFSGQGADRRAGQGAGLGNAADLKRGAMSSEDDDTLTAPGVGLRLGSNLDVRL